MLFPTHCTTFTAAAAFIQTAPGVQNVPISPATDPQRSSLLGATSPSHHLEKRKEQGPSPLGRSPVPGTPRLLPRRGAGSRGEDEPPGLVSLQRAVSVPLRRRSPRGSRLQTQRPGKPPAGECRLAASDLRRSQGLQSGGRKVEGRIKMWIKCANGEHHLSPVFSHQHQITQNFSLYSVFYISFLQV